MKFQRKMVHLAGLTGIVGVAVGCSGAGLAPSSAGESTQPGAAQAAATALPFGRTQFVDKQGRLLETTCPRTGPAMVRCMSLRIVAGEEVTMTSGLTATQLEQAYELPSAASSGGAIIAIVDVGGYGSNQNADAFSDLTTYRKAYGLPTMTQCSGLPVVGGAPCFAFVGETGGAPSTTDQGWTPEMALDLDMVSASCPDCSIVLVSATSQANADFDAAEDYAASIPGVSAVSNSYGWPEDTTPGSPFTGMFNAADATHYDHEPVLIMAAGGDDEYDGEDTSTGYGGKAPLFPGSAPDVVAVGGTLLTAGGGGARGWTEVVWNAPNGSEQLGTGSGCSHHFRQPKYQKGLTGTCAKKATNDVSAAADATGGILIYETPDYGGYVGMLGTSAATPFSAGVFTRMKLAAKIGGDIGWIYKHTGDFFDVTSGDNDPYPGCKDTTLCNAGVGWDGPTGWGTPNGSLL